MKNLFKFFLVILLVGFSFYYTEKIALIIQSKNELMIYIRDNKANYESNYVNAIIENDTIIPGLKGYSVDDRASFLKMKEIKAFNEYYLVYEDIEPEISVINNKDKTIIQGNKQKKQVAFITRNNSSLIAKLKAYNISLDNTGICLKDLNEACQKNDYKVKASLIINHQNILKEKSNITSGEIILLEDNITTDELELIIKEIKYRDLKIVSLNELIQE